MYGISLLCKDIKTLPAGVQVLQGESWLDVLDNPNQTVKQKVLPDSLGVEFPLKWQRMEARLRRRLD